MTTSPHPLRAAAALLALGLAADALAQGAPPPAAAASGPATVKVVSDPGGVRLTVDGRDFMVLGMNWDYFPIGQNYGWSLWTQPDDVVEEALAREMPLLRAMGVNAIRVYAGMPARWVRHVYERYGIYTILNHTVARYGYTLDGVWIPSVDYSDPRLRAAVEAEVLALVDEFKDVPGVLMWLLGNENNYGLHWRSSAIEALPEGQRDVARARHLYSLFGEITRAVKARDPRHPVAIANGDVQYLDLIAEEVKGLDVFGANVYRGRSARDLFDVVKEKLGIPVMFTEFGADAYDAKRMREDDLVQARYLVAQWQEIYEQSSGKGRAGNAVGGLVFQWSDGWWKYRQEENLDVHDTHASWPNGGYAEDFVAGRNNMNEEWWGICAKGPPDARGLFDVYPRAAYYALQEAFRLPPYAPGTDLAAVRAHFAAIAPAALAIRSRADRAALRTSFLERATVLDARLSFQTFSTGGSNVLPVIPYGFDHTESFYAGFQVKPSDRVTASMTVNVLGNVAVNPIDEIFYERRGQPAVLVAEARRIEVQDRVKIYAATLAWEEPWFEAKGFFRTGHYHWGAEGDLFGLYREANYGENLDIYAADAPLGMEVAARGPLEGLKVAFGPQLWWGANPAILAKYRRAVGPAILTLVHDEELAQQLTLTTSAAAPQRQTRRTTLQLETSLGGVGLQVGGIWAGWNKVDETFDVAERTGAGWQLTQDRVLETDTLGAKAKVTWERGRWHAYAQGAYMGLVADGGPTAVQNYTGWTLVDSGSGNQANAIAGVAVHVGDFQLAPNFLWQKPLVGPIPFDAGPQRNTLPEDLGGRGDPFAVRRNRETVGGELMVTWDPTPATWLWAWDNDVREDARIAASLDLAFRHQPTTADPAIGFLADGTPIAIGAPPPHDLWEARGRIVSRPRPDLRLVAHAWVGSAEPNGADARLVHRAGGDFRVAWRQLVLAGFVKKDDYGPYDYHRDYNLTFPWQLMGDVSYVLETARWFGQPQTRLGLRGTWRSLDRNSPRYLYASDPVSRPLGSEYEIRTYVDVSL
jgi:hypothetical protein